MQDDELKLDGIPDFEDGVIAPPFEFEFAVFCPWAALVEVLVHSGQAHGRSDPTFGSSKGISQHLLMRLQRMEGSLWCGTIVLPGRDHQLSYRATGQGQTVVAPFAGGYHAPGTFAQVVSRATYPGRRKSGGLCG